LRSLGAGVDCGAVLLLPGQPLSTVHATNRRAKLRYPSDGRAGPRRQSIRPAIGGVQFAETDGPLLFASAKNEECAAELEDDFALPIADIASRVLKREIELVVVLPMVLQ
jgi:hypothetical protein